MPNQQNLNQNNLTSRLTTLMAIRMSASIVGNIAGWGLAYHKKSGFWGYVGWGLLGGLVIGGLATVATMPMAASIVNDQNIQP